MRKTKKDSELTRQSLLDAALEVFYSKGVTKATINDIAQKANVTRGALYWHFKNKEEVLQILCSQFIESDQKKLEKALYSEHVWETLSETMKSLFHEVIEDENRHHFSCIMFQDFGMRDYTSILRPILIRYHDMWKSYLYQGIRLAKEKGELPPARNTDWAFFQLNATFIGLMKILIGPVRENQAAGYIDKIVDESMQLIVFAPE